MGLIVSPVQWYLGDARPGLPQLGQTQLHGVIHGPLCSFKHVAQHLL